MGEIADQVFDEIMNPHLWEPDEVPGWWCPKCGGEPKKVNTQYGIKRECCGLWGWGKNAPLVDRETHEARSYAHKVFDSLWQSGLVGRSRAYALLADELGIDPADCHMKLMDKETASRVPAAAHAIGKRLKGSPTCSN